MSRNELLMDVMRDTRTTQTQLSRISGVHQPSISQFLSGRTEMSDDMLERLLECMGYRLEVVRRSVEPEMTRSERRSWRLHRQLSTHLTTSSLMDWMPAIQSNLDRLRLTTVGEPHVSNLDRWDELIERQDVPRIRRVLTGLDRHSIEMREVSPLGGLLSQEERSMVLAGDR